MDLFHGQMISLREFEGGRKGGGVWAGRKY